MHNIHEAKCFIAYGESSLYTCNDYMYNIHEAIFFITYDESSLDARND